MASQISKILPTLLIIAAAFLLNFGCCQQNESQTTETLAATYVSSSTEALPLNTTIAFSNETTTEATPSPTEAGTNSTTADDTNDEQSLLFWILIGVIVAIVLFLVLLVCIVCCMRRGSQEDARETVNGESGGAVTKLTMNGDNADSSNSASQSASEPDEGWFVPDKLPNNTMTDLAKVNARLAQRKKQQQAQKQ
ncbi:hypothetical protein niasHS_007887 [Heterodera schachtii]|uniref:Uncharacterized protein n=1 Tax=Heterodera schachtii TaxID=97005 RepID=A0ABD2JQH2_HETSC